MLAPIVQTGRRPSFQIVIVRIDIQRHTEYLEPAVVYCPNCGGAETQETASNKRRCPTCATVFSVQQYHKTTGARSAEGARSPRRGRNRPRGGQSAGLNYTWIITGLIVALAVGAYVFKNSKSGPSATHRTSSDDPLDKGLAPDAKKSMAKLEHAFGRLCHGVSPRDIRNITFVVVASYPEEQIIGVLDDLAEVHNGQTSALARLTAQEDSIEQVGAHCAAMISVNNVSGRAAETYLKVYGKYRAIEKKAKAKGTTLDATISKIYSQ
jgi:hypothetical protein